ncbi:hypothetical protein [Inquilinus limosus]|uniref:hypothetical protein n=1 Tax=Inquilinus limosus TaxID=171674 RepID=UPI00042A38EB|nr:hypothetical protein [Inquilinus limosus]
MSDNVVGLRGAYVPPAVEETPAANPTVVEELERLLEAAKAGEIVGLAGAYLHKDRVVGYSYAGPVSGYAVIGALECMKERLLRIALSQD